MAARRSRASRQRTPRGTLNRAKVVRAGLELTRGDDAPPLTVGRVAAALNTRPMSLYTHIENREDLANAVADLALREWVVDFPASLLWDDRVRRWCLSLRDHLRRYPSLVFEIARGGKFQPTMLDKVAVLNHALRDAGLEGEALAGVLRWIPQTALGAIVLELARPGDLQSGDDEAAAVYASIGAASPETRRELADVLPHFLDKGLDDLFAYSIDRLIDGIRAVVQEESE